MHKPKHGVRQSGSRSALRTVSNNQSTLAGGWSSPSDPQRTPTQRTPFAQRAKTESSKKFNHSVHRRLSQSHGDLSKLRPRTPPIYGLPAELCGLRLSPGNFVDDVHSHFSPSYNTRSRQALPSNWTANRPVTQSNEDSRPIHLSSYEDLSPPTDASTCNATPEPIAIQGLSLGISIPLDLFKPLIRTYPSNDYDQGYIIHGPAVQHIDVKTSWTFSEYAEAQELCRIDRAFTVTLERMLASELWNVCLQDCIPKMSGVKGCVAAEVVRGISFCREQLVGDLADSLYATQEDIRFRAQLGLIKLYLAASDCLVQHDGTHSRDTSITVRVHHDARSQAPHPFVQAAWVPDSIIFNNLAGTRFLREGQDFSIIPRYQRNSAFASTRFPTNVRYSIESQNSPFSWLTWDDSIAGFKGIVPMYSATQMGGRYRNFFAPVGSLCIDVKAVIVEDNGSFVQYERTVRARLTINIFPWDDSFGPSSCQGIESDLTQYSCKPQRVDGIVPSVVMSRMNTSSSPQMYDRQSILSSEQKPDFTSSAARPEIKAAWSNLAQEHAHPAAKYVDISQRLADTEKHVRLLMSLGGYEWAQIQRRQPDLQANFAGYHESPFSNRLDMGSPVARDPSASSYVPERAADNTTSPLRFSPHQTAPRTPRINGRAAVQDQVIGPSSNIRFPASPPAVVRSAPSQTFNDITQPWTHMYPPQRKPTHYGRRSESGTRFMKLTPQHGPTSYFLSVLPKAKCYLHRSPMEDRDDLTTADPTQNPAPPFISASDGAETVKLKEGSRKRHAISSPSNASPPKQPKEIEHRSKSTNSELGMALCSCYSPLPDTRDFTLDASWPREATFLNLPNPAGRSEGDASVPMRRGRRSSHPRTDPIYHSGLHDVGSEAQPLRILADPVQSTHGVPTPPDSLNSMSPTVSDSEAKEQKPWDCGSGQERPIKMFTSYQTFFSGERSASVHSWQTSSSFSHAASSNIEVTVEGPHDRIGRSEQAKVWHRLSESESSDKENKSKAAKAEPRLNEDEKEAIREAIERSLDDMTESFDGIFLNDSDELASEDETSATDEL